MLNQDAQVSMHSLIANSIRLEHQVAGNHRLKDAYMLLNCNDGTILKPLQSPPRGKCEHDFYQQVANVTHESNPDLWQLKTFLPAYYGYVKSASSQTTSVGEFIRMENVLNSFSKPCVMDVKIGRITYDPTASEAKKEAEIFKYPPRMSLGFVVLGMKIYECGEYVFYDKMFGRSLVEEDILMKGLGRFFGWPDRPKHEIVTSVLKQLRNILQWFTSQRQLSFYASSILIVYEGSSDDVTSELTLSNVEKRKNSDVSQASTYEKFDISSNEFGKDGSEGVHERLDDGRFNSLDNNLTSEQIDACLNTVERVSRNNNNKGDSEIRENLAVVKMIDFTHVFPTTVSDENYIYGLNKLISFLEQLMSSH